MDETLIFDVTRQALWIAVRMSAPLLVVALVTGVAIGLFQALTSVQEMTLTFVPKVVIVFGALILLMPFMLTTLVTFTQQLADRIIGMGTG